MFFYIFNRKVLYIINNMIYRLYTQNIQSLSNNVIIQNVRKIKLKIK